ncbi:MULTISPECIES: AAA family ATPase [Haloferax]|uniref:AAA family ATPase n=1 Tax=Haloferax TaxID=2251 RepID=UPI0012B0FB94|nr:MULTISPECIES: AAA family ATPase [Haloferax]
MVSESPFVGREDELRKACELIDGETSGTFNLLFGPGGHGKTRFLKELKTEYQNDEDVFVLDFTFHAGLTTIQNFASEFQSQWSEKVDTSRTQKIKNKAYSVLQSRGFEIGVKLTSNAGGMIFPPASLLSLGADALPEADTKESAAPIYAEILREFLRQFNQFNPDAKLILFFDQYDEIPLEQKDTFNRFFRSIAETVPDSVNFFIGARSRKLATGYNSPIETIELNSLGKAEVEEFLNKRGLNTSESQIDRVIELTQGTPYLLDRFSDLANERGVQRAIEAVPQTEVREYLDTAFLNRMQTEEEDFIYSICALAEFREDIVAELTEYRLSESRRMLESLYQQGALEKVGTHEAMNVYRPHSFLHEQARRLVKDEELNQQHRYCAKIYLNELDADPIDANIDVLIEFIIGNEVENEAPLNLIADAFAQSMAAGQMFSHHLNEISSKKSKEEEIVRLLNDPAIDEDSVLPHLSNLFAGDDVNIARVRASIFEYEEPEALESFRARSELQPEEQLVADYLRTKRVQFRFHENSSNTQLDTLKDISQRVKALTKNPDVDIVAGVLFIYVSMFRQTVLKHQGKEAEAEQVVSEIDTFFAETYSLDTSDVEYIVGIFRNLVQAIEQDISEEESNDLLLDLSEGSVEKGIYGGIQRGFREGFLQLMSALSEARTDGVLSRNQSLIKNAIIELSIYFNQNGNHSLAAAVRDIATVVSQIVAPAGSENIEQHEWAFVESRAFEQFKRVVTIVR